MERTQLKSLQQQYIVFSGVLVVIIVFAILFNRAEISEQYDELSTNRTQAAEILVITTKLRDHINTITSSIDIVMLDPKMQDQIDLIFTASFNEMKSLVAKARSNRTVSKEEDLLLQTFDQNITLFNRYALELYDIRSDVDRQYPSMAVSNEIILPARNEVNSIFRIAINESEDEKLILYNKEAYDDLINARRQWDKTVSLFRLYLANKLAATVREDFFYQENNIDQYILELTVLIKKLFIHLNNDVYGFESSDQLLTLNDAINAWVEGVDKVKEIHNSEKWRMDAYYMRNSIFPIVYELVDNLQALDELITIKSIGLEEETSKLSNQQSFYLIIITIIFVIYSFMVFVFLRKLVFQPLTKFSNSIRSQVFDLDEAELMRLANTKETFVLIDSFIEMQHQSVARRDELTFQALHDSLTGLPNRKALLINLKQNIKSSNRNDSKLSFLMLDLNKFKDVNDTLGHLVGDKLLVKVGERLTSQLRDVDMVARLGGDEFSIVLPGTSRKDATKVAKKINKALKAAFSVDDYLLHVGVSIGITEYPSDGKSSTELMQYADVAMYESKRHSTIYSFYDSEKDGHSLQRLSLTQDLKLAIKEKQIKVFYQPKLAVTDLKPIGSEALLRWTHPELGFISPEHIIELAEDGGLIDELTLLIIDVSLRDHQRLIKHGYHLKIAINLSVHNLKDVKFVENVKNLIDKSHVEANEITFEITESAMMADPETSINMMNSLTELGVHLSVDDFGTGFSSLAYLKKLPVSELKIDRSFVNDIATDQSDKVIVQSTIDLSHNLGLTVVAEGVENERSLIILKELGCDVSQGYYFSKPLSYLDFKNWLQDTY